MRIVKAEVIKRVIEELCLKANTELRSDILLALRRAHKKETLARARRVLGILIENAEIAKRKKIPICQDTGMVIAYIRRGQNVFIKGNIKSAVSEGVRLAYRKGFFRNSVVVDPFLRQNTETNLPPVFHFDVIPGNKIELRVLVKGFGSENTSTTKMFNPTSDVSDVEEFVLNVVKDKGPGACPPLYIGIGIGGTIDKAVALSKEAVFRDINTKNTRPYIRQIEKRLLGKINRTGIGPGGLGGRTTALGVSILTYPTHIAGLPVAVNLSCYATRDAVKTI